MIEISEKAQTYLTDLLSQQDDKDVEQHLGEPDSHVPGRALMPTVELRLCISNVGRGPRHLAA